MSVQSVLFDAPGPRARARHAVLTVVGVVLVLAVLVGVLLKLRDAGQLQPYMWLAFLDPVAWTAYLIPGLIGTLMATVVSVVLAGAFGVVFGAGRLSRNPWIRRPCGIVVEFFRAVPVLIMMIFAFQMFARSGWFVSSINPLLGVVTGLTLYNGSVIAELVRSGVHALPAGQREAGLAIGLTDGQTLRNIQLPQALVAMLPALIAQLVVVLKDSALGIAVTYTDLLFWSKTLGSAYANTVPAYIVAAVIYIILNYAVIKLAEYVERRLRRTSHVAGPITNAEPTVVQGGGEPGASGAAGFEDLRGYEEEMRHRA